MDENAREDDNQQIASAAEAMVQLSGAYGQQSIQEESSMDVDPNYDPSDFLGNLKREPQEQKPQLGIDISKYEQMNTYQGVAAEALNDMAGEREEPIEQKPAAIHDDLAISDSDEEGGGRADGNDDMVQENEYFTPAEPLPMTAAPPEPVPEQSNSTETKDNNNDDDADNDLLWF